MHFTTGTNPTEQDSEWNLIAKILIVLNSMSSLVGGVSDSISYAGPPIVNPPAIQSIVVDSNGRQWQYYGGAWH